MLTILADDAMKIQLVRDTDLMITHCHTFDACQCCLCTYTNISILFSVVISSCVRNLLITNCLRHIMLFSA